MPNGISIATNGIITGKNIIKLKYPLTLSLANNKPSLELRVNRKKIIVCKKDC